jgi:hypothetical protein
MSCLKLFSPVDDAPSSGFLSVFRGDDESPPDFLPFRHEPQGSSRPRDAVTSFAPRDRRSTSSVESSGDVCIVRMLPPCPVCREVSLDFSTEFPRLLADDEAAPVCRCRRCEHEWVTETPA